MLKDGYAASSLMTKFTLDVVILTNSEESHLYIKHEILRASSQNDNVKMYCHEPEDSFCRPFSIIFNS